MALCYTEYKGGGIMKDRKRMLLCILLAFLLIGSAVIRFDPYVRAEKFVGRWGSRVEQSLAAGHGLPADLPEYDIRDGEHRVIEFTLIAWGLVPQSSYYGCYYSFDDVPVAYDPSAELEPVEEGCWQWQGEGDNRGATRKIRDHWYYFEAAF